jgi:small subunit ribosomal protein S9
MAQQKVAEKVTAVKKSPKKAAPKTGKPLVGATGRRKKAIARVWVRRGSGAVIVNGLNFKEYFDTSATYLEIAKPFSACAVASDYDYQVTVTGGGKVGQSHAVKLGLSRALLEMDANLRPALRQNGLLTVDSRVKERKKYGQKGARGKFQFVKR